MELSEKLVNLFISFIEKSTELKNLSERNRSINCDITEDGENYSISIKPYIESIDSNQQDYSIVFRDLESKVGYEQYLRINSEFKNKISIFEAKELESKKQQQTIIVDRLLEKFKK